MRKPRRPSLAELDAYYRFPSGLKLARLAQIKEWVKGNHVYPSPSREKYLARRVQVEKAIVDSNK